MKTYIFGLGTGRCGTQSLAKLLNAQQESKITHEYSSILPWDKDIVAFDNKFKEISSRSGHFIGDVASYYLPYTSHILRKVSQEYIKFIILKRDINEVCESFMRKTHGRNHWQSNHSGRKCKWDIAFPCFNSLHTKREAIKEYYHLYYDMCAEIPEDLKYIINTNDLNSPGEVNRMLDWVGFNNPTFKKIHINKGV
jgi:hypothetical protein